MKARDPVHAMVLRQPEPMETEPFGFLRQGHAVLERLCSGRALRNGGEVQDGEGDHDAKVRYIK